MSTLSSPLYYSARLTPTSRYDDWCVDAVSRPPEVLFNFRKVAVDVIVIDLRDGSIEPRLGDTGFAKVVAPSGVDQRALLAGSTASVAEYQRETGALLKSHVEADEVLFFDVTLRQEGVGALANSSSQPAHQGVHVDQSPNAAAARAADHGRGRGFRRFQIVNVWRPLIEPVRNYPLAMCDYRSGERGDRSGGDEVAFSRLAQGPRELFGTAQPTLLALTHPRRGDLFKYYDSASRNMTGASGDTQRGELLDVAGLCPHTAFFDEQGPTTGHLRISLEMRALVFYY